MSNDAAVYRTKLGALRDAARELVRLAPDVGASNRCAYVEHAMLCSSVHPGGEPCDCGLVEWQRALAAVERLLR